jgi:hypothetical protein
MKITKITDIRVGDILQITCLNNLGNEVLYGINDSIPAIAAHEDGYRHEDYFDEYGRLKSIITGYYYVIRAS